MIQRIQSIYLFLAALCMLGFIFMPTIVYTAGAAPHIEGAISGVNDIDTPYYIFLVLEILIALLAFATIFKYKDLKQQARLCKINILLCFALIGTILGVWLTRKSDGATPTLWVALAFLAVIFLFLALKGINKDRNLLAESNRLR